MQNGARNQPKGTVTSINKGARTAHVGIQVDDSTIASSITNPAVDELGLTVGSVAYEVVKASDVMVAVD
ncbi:TOBE domain-containing protein [Arthrobacter sp. LAPM80]|uniref:TOBE domain-containing protein n=1 Tax=Arthrobacter sp. LAPM80 TaxID=3141788 RepID=UPI00398ABE95